MDQEEDILTSQQSNIRSAGELDVSNPFAKRRVVTKESEPIFKKLHEAVSMLTTSVAKTNEAVVKLTTSVDNLANEVNVFRSRLNSVKFSMVFDSSK